MKYVMFIVSENTTACLRGKDCKNVKDFLNIIKKEHFSKCMEEIISQVESYTDEDWNEEMRFMSMELCVNDTRFGVHIAEC